MKYFIISAFMLGQVLQLLAQPCTPSYEYSNVSVYNFNLADMTHTNAEASEGGYDFYPESVVTTDLEIGKTYPITMTSKIDAGNLGIFSVWLDYNNDSLFSEEELIYRSSAGYYGTGLISIPQDASLAGKKRLRVSAIKPPALPMTPCGTYLIGATNDYEVTITTANTQKDYYCLPFDVLDMDNFNINEFMFGELSNVDYESNETNYTVYEEIAVSGTYMIGAAYEMGLSKGFPAGNTGSYAAWIDYNSNYIFEEEEQIFQSEENVHNATTMITIPNDPTLIGKKRLRIRSQWGGGLPMDPCGFSGGTETEDYTITIINPLVSINDFDGEEKVDIFPNPCTELLRIKSPSSKNYHYTVMNDFGQLQTSGSLNNQQLYTINVSQLPAGVYILQLIEGGKSKQYKFFKT